MHFVSAGPSTPQMSLESSVVAKAIGEISIGRKKLQDVKARIPEPRLWGSHRNGRILREPITEIVRRCLEVTFNEGPRIGRVEV